MFKFNLTAILLVCWLLLISCGGEIESQTDMSAPWTIADVPVAPAVAMANSYPRVEAKFPGGVVGLQDLVYSEIHGYRPLRLDMYLPPDTGTVH